MQVGVGLPNAVPGVSGDSLLRWARRAEELGFTSLGVVDRVVYQCYSPLATLAAAGAVTTRVRLATTVLIGPLRNDALLAREAATVDAISQGRLTLGVALGARRDDYDASGVDYATRAGALDRQLAALRSYWDGGTGPRPSNAGGPELLVGGSSDAAFARMARMADGYVLGGGPPRLFERAAATARAAWSDAGRAGRPRLWAQGYFALGQAGERGRAYMRHYYGFTGPFAEKIAEGMLGTPQAVRQFIGGYAEAGCDELVLFPATSDIEQLELLADARG